MPVTIEPMPKTGTQKGKTNDLTVQEGNKRVNVLQGIIEDREDCNIDSLIAFAGGTHEGVDAFLSAMKRFNEAIHVDRRHKANDKGKKSHFQRKVNV